MDFFLRGALLGLQILGRLLALPENVRLGWKSLKVRDTLAYESLCIIFWIKDTALVVEDIFSHK